MLPTAFHDVTALHEVDLSTWEKILEAAGESGRISHPAFTHEALWNSLVNDPPAESSLLLDALEAILELGTENGRELLQQAAEDQQVDLQVSDAEPSQELAARVWITSQDSNPSSEVLRRARVHARETGHARNYREFAGKRALGKISFDRKRLLTAVQAWCKDRKTGEAVEIYVYERGGELRAEILRGEAIKRVIQIQKGHPTVLNFRPATADHIRLDPETSRLGIASRSARLLQGYREILGRLLANDEEFFAGENICTLRPLQERGSQLFELHRIPGIQQVDVVELRWHGDDRARIVVRGRDCFKVLDDLGARLNEGELVEAKLQLAFAGTRKRGHVSLKVPNRIDIKAGTYERSVEQLLDEAGIRGSFGDEAERRNLWDLYPWRMPEGEWRRNLGTSFDNLLKQKVLRPITLEAVAHPDHPANPRALTVVALYPNTLVGISDDDAIHMRTLTPSDVGGYELDLAPLAGEMSKALSLEGAVREVVSGVWLLARLPLRQSQGLNLLLVGRRPLESDAAIIRNATQGSNCMLLVPTGCASGLGFPEIECSLPQGPYDCVLERIVVQLALQNELSPPLWIRDDLILQEGQGRAWYRKVELTTLRVDSHPFKFASAVAKAGGRVVPRGELNELLSPSRTDGDVAKKAKLDFIKAVETSFERADVKCPPEARKIFGSRGGGYAIDVSARIL